MEKDVDKMRKQNEKLAKAIRRVKDEPELVDEVDRLTKQGLDSVESQIKSEKLERAKDEVAQ